MILKFIFFIAVFFSIYLGMHYYIGFHASKFLSIDKILKKPAYKSIFFHLVIIGFSSLYIISNIFSKKLQGPIIDWFYVFSSILLGIIFISFSVLIIYDIIRHFAQVPTKIAGTLVFGLILLLTIVSLFNAKTIAVKEVDIPIEGLKKQLRIVQLSDIHLDTINQQSYLKRIVRMTNELNPDVVVITGDIVDGSAKMDKDLFLPLNDINAPTIVIFGNHEFYEGADKVTALLEKTKVNIIRNDVIQIKEIQFIGLDDPSFGSSIEELIQNISLREELVSILLYHQPIGYEEAQKKGIDLMLSGHTHKGQIFPFNLLVRLRYKYVSGLHEFKDMKVYVSSGTGFWGPPMRLGSRNEITLLNLRHK